MPQIDTGDVVFHAPSGEKWTVAFVSGDRLAWCGYPEGSALVSDCTLVEKVSPEARLNLLYQLAGMSDQTDSRQRYAKAFILAERSQLLAALKSATEIVQEEIAVLLDSNCIVENGEPILSTLLPIAKPFYDKYANVLTACNTAIEKAEGK